MKFFTGICVGFGVSTPEKAKQVAQIADGVIVGSSIVKMIEKTLFDELSMLQDVRRFAEGLSKGVKEIIAPQGWFRASLERNRGGFNRN